jgi:ATP-dependent DNA helicase RecG
MKTRFITEDEANLLSAKEEGHFYDRKALAISGKKIQKITVAYANADGGEVLIGLADDKEQPDALKRWHGASKPEDFNPHLQALFEVKPSLDVRYELLSCDTKVGLVLRVQVEKSSQVHHTADQTVYQRLGAQSLPISDPQKIMELSFAKGFTSFED